MKLAEALLLRADAQTRLSQLQKRMIQNAKVQEGDRPAEDPNELLAEYESTADELTRLIQQINRTNLATVLDDGQTLTDALAVRDVLKLRASAHRALATAGLIEQNRYSRSEIRFESTVDIGVIRKQADAYAKDHRELDAKIQAANWTTDLLDN